MNEGCDGCEGAKSVAQGFIGVPHLSPSRSLSLVEAAQAVIVTSGVDVWLEEQTTRWHSWIASGNGLKLQVFSKEQSRIEKMRFATVAKAAKRKVV